MAMTRFQEPGFLLVRAQEGDETCRNALIKKFTPFILRVASNVSGRYVRLGSDDEASIGLIAFNEAINNFREEKGVSFLSFADTVIRRRLIDFFRKESKAQKVLPLSTFDDPSDESGEDASNRLEVHQAQETFRLENESSDRRAEIVQYDKLLRDYGLSFAELVEVSPKHEDARRRAIEVARLISETKEYSDYLKLKGSLPLKALEKEVDMSRKTLERQRKYIIAVTIVFLENLEYLKEYINKV
ncbi:RNA polymerase sigma factor SigI [Heliorestis acidaminivorans]|uniref:RNA polymerase sigma factor SigI n=2 Tax=Heliorestis acidaminivorans TaxID=553427 RepID=A0A6I0EZK4_9FIRM|nr:RNA polymerase sigma factor SigI [Heliorestis acidaminivorans]